MLASAEQLSYFELPLEAGKATAVVSARSLTTRRTVAQVRSRCGNANLAEGGRA